MTEEKKKPISPEEHQRRYQEYLDSLENETGKSFTDWHTENYNEKPPPYIPRSPNSRYGKSRAK